MPTYSLWFEPPPALAPKYQAHIDRLQQRVASETSFVPHVTLLGGVDGPEQRVTGAASQLAASLEPFPIRFARAARGDIFHQCVFLLAETSDELMKARLLPGAALVHGRKRAERASGCLAPRRTSLRGRPWGCRRGITCRTCRCYTPTSRRRSGRKLWTSKYQHLCPCHSHLH